mmetsp:Transcript_25245/g.47917  ORF Transcript_25245/g.47917 Transcript_25245/m.47917 type:complete len:671 (-) Transcript_25245:1190-3202(-)
MGKTIDVPQTSETTGTNDEETRDSEDQSETGPGKNKPKARNMRLLLWLLLGGCIIVGVMVAVIVASSSGDSETSTSTDSNAAEEIPTGDEDCPSPVDDNEGDDGRFLRDQDFWSIGCFLRQASVDEHPLVTAGTASEQAEACHNLCVTRHFGVSDNTCYCYVASPQQRLTVGSCSTACGTPRDQRMEAYVNLGDDTECNQAATTSVRNFLAEEDDAPFGFDLIRNTFRSSPFELFKQECGTNMYEVQTEASENSNVLSTSVETVEAFAEERRAHLSSSVSASASASYKGLFAKASVKVSASMDREQNSIFQSSGASSVGSKVFTSTGVKRLAEVKLVDFENRLHFVTFNEQFANLLRAYRDSDFAEEKAKEIIAKYGQLVVTRGIFGGYVQLRSTVSSQDIKSLFNSEEDSRRCYEASVSGQASGFGFKGSFSVGADGCTESAAKSLSEKQSTFAQETSSQSVVGGQVVDGELVVSPSLSTLLTSQEHYPQSDNGIQLRLLSDFLAPDKINPLEVRRYQITENDFGKLRSNLEAHILNHLQEVSGVLSECSDCSVSYLELEDGSLQCQCYNPHSEEPSRHVPNAYCEYYAAGGDGPCEVGKPFDEIWQRCIDDGLDKCMGVMWNSCTGPTSDTTVNGAWKLMKAGQDIGNANNPTSTCGDGLGHWDAFLR